MAASRWASTLYPSEQFVEACGAIVFDTSCKPRKVCLLYYGKKDEWLLPKGRRNCNESRQDAAVREVEEESGYVIRLRPMTMVTRAPSESEAPDVRDAARSYEDITEPFMLDVRDQGAGGGKGVKLVWWFIAEVEGIAGEGEVQFKPQFIRCDKAVERLTFQKDRDVLKRAIEIMEHQPSRHGGREHVG